MKTLILACVIILGGIVGYSYYNKTDIVVSEAKLIDYYSSFEQMDNDAGIIIVGKKVNGKNIINKDEFGDPNWYYTLSDFTIEEVVKNETDKKIDTNQNIAILETVAFDEEHQQILSVNGYLPMENNNRYILFLEPNDSTEGPAVGSFNIKGVVFGKFAFDKNEDARAKVEEKESKKYESTIKKVRKEMYKELVTKYKKHL